MDKTKLQATIRTQALVIESLIYKNSVLQSQNQSISEHIQNNKEKMIELKDKNTELVNRVECLCEYIDQFQSVVNSYQLQIAEHEMEFKSSVNQITLLRQDNKLLREQLTNSQSTHNNDKTSSTEEIIQLKQQITQLQSMNKQLTNDVNNYQHAIKEERNLNSQERIITKETQNKIQSNLTISLEKYKTENEKLKKICKNQENGIKQLNTFINDIKLKYKTYISEKETRQNEIMRVARQQIEELKNENEILKSSNEKLTIDISEKTKLAQNRFSDRENISDEYKVIIQKCEMLSNEVKQKNLEISVLKEEISKLRSNYEMVYGVNSTMKQNYNNFEENKQNVLSELEICQREVKSGEIKLENLEREYNMSLEEVEKLSIEKEELKKKIQDLNEEINSNGKDLELRNTYISQLESKVLSLECELDRRKGERVIDKNNRLNEYPYVTPEPIPILKTTTQEPTVDRITQMMSKIKNLSEERHCLVKQLPQNITMVSGVPFSFSNSNSQIPTPSRSSTLF